MAYYKGGNGQLTTSSSVAVTSGTKYTIVVGAGGAKNTKGGDSTAFGLTGTGGAGATNSANGANAGNGSGGAGSSSGTGAAGWVSFSYSVVTPQYCKITLGTS